MDAHVMEQLLRQTLNLYDFKRAETEFIRHNENMTYKVIDADKKYLLRIHKSAEGFTPLFFTNYNQRELIQSEIEIISALKKGADISVQTPVGGINGEFVQFTSENIPVTLLEWVEGDTVENAGTTPEILFNAGKMMAEMHAFFSSNTELGKHYKRYSLDQTILPLIAEKIENAAYLNILKKEQANIIITALNEMKIRFDELDNIHEKHIIHSDLGKQNMITDKNSKVTPIDFSLCGYGHFYMDINMFNGDLKFSPEIIAGYKSVRDCEINPRYMEPYVALGFVMFIAAQYERSKEWDWFPNAVENMCRDAFQPLAEKTNFVTI